MFKLIKYWIKIWNLYIFWIHLSVLYRTSEISLMKRIIHVLNDVQIEKNIEVKCFEEENRHSQQNNWAYRYKLKIMLIGF